jgi:hypothetical protein
MTAAPRGARAPAAGGGPAADGGKRFFARDTAGLRALWTAQGGACGLCGQAIHEERLEDGSYAQVGGGRRRRDAESPA